LYKLVGLVETLPEAEPEIRKFCNSFHVNFETQLAIRFLYYLDTISETSSLGYVHQIGIELQNGMLWKKNYYFVLFLNLYFQFIIRSFFLSFKV